MSVRCTNEVEDTRLTEAGADCVVRDDIVTAEVISTALTLLLKAHQTRTVNSQRPVKSPTSLLPLTTGAVSNPTLLSFTTRLRGAYSDSRKQLESIVRSVRSLGEEYVWLSDADLLEQTANAAAKDTEPALASQYSHGESEREVIEGVIVCSLKPQQHDSK